MKRDMDLVRNILLKIEADERAHLPVAEFVFENTSRLELAHHTELVEAAGFIAPVTHMRSSEAIDYSWDQTIGYKLTWDGHEFLDTIRDPEIWNKTKSGAKQVGSWSIELLGDLAKGLIKAKAAELGLPLG